MHTKNSVLDVLSHSLVIGNQFKGEKTDHLWCVNLLCHQHIHSLVYTHLDPNTTDIITKERKTHLKMNKVGMLLPKKRVNTSGVGKINNYCEDIIPPYNNTH